MNNKFKNLIIANYLLAIYVYIFLGYKYFLIISILYILYIIYKINKEYNTYLLITIKLFTFLIFIFYFIIFDRLVIGIFLCGMDGVGYLQRSGIVDYKYACYEFTLYEDLLLNFVSSLYYPVYILIFFKPFVNHLDKSIQKIKEELKKAQNNE